MRTNAVCPAAIIVAILMTLVTASHAFGSGFAVFAQGAEALGQATAVTAHNQSPSTIFYNPALIVNLPGTWIEAGTTMITPDRMFTSRNTGHRESAEAKASFPSTLYVTHAFNNDLSIGVGAFNPFGIGSTWCETWEGRYLTTHSDLFTYAVNPVVAYRIIPRVSLALGVDFVWLDTNQEKMINTAALTGLNLADSRQTFSGNGEGTGYNIGLCIEISETISLGLAYRSEIDIDIDGEVTFARSDASLAALLPDTTGRSHVTLPQQVYSGIAYRPSGRLVMEIGIRWEDWTSYDELKIQLDQQILGQTEITSRKDWHDTYTYLVGGRYTINDRVALLAGYRYSKSPIPDNTFEPQCPASNSHMFSLGFDINYDNIAATVSYAGQWYEDKDKNNTVTDFSGTSANGKYESYLHMLAVSMSYKF